MEDDSEDCFSLTPNTNPTTRATTTPALTPSPCSISASSCSSASSNRKSVRPTSMGFPNQQQISSTTCSTPVLDPRENDLLKRQHTLHTFDSGYSEWTPTPDSTPCFDNESQPKSLQLQQSQNETPLICSAAVAVMPGVDDEMDSNLFSPLASDFSELSPVQTLIKNHNHRRSWPLRTRRLSFQSSATTDSPHSHQSRDDTEKNFSSENTHKTDSVSNSMYLSSATAQSCIALNQQDDEVDGSFPSLSTHSHSHSPVPLELSSVLRLGLQQSRHSSSRSPLHSSSDELEGSFQEMSLEENSSSSSCSSSQLSPASLSSSPVFTFKDCRKFEASPLPDAAYSQRKLSCLTWEEQEQSTTSTSVSPHLNIFCKNQNRKSGDRIIRKNKKTHDLLNQQSLEESRVSLASNTSTTSISHSHLSIPSSSIDSHNLSSSCQTPFYSKPTLSCRLSVPTSNSFTVNKVSSSYLPVPSISSIISQNDCKSCKSNSPFTCTHFVKSPTKRSNLIPKATTSYHSSDESEPESSVSPLKMRRLKKSASSGLVEKVSVSSSKVRSSNSKKELFSFDSHSSSSASTEDRHQLHNSPGSHNIFRLLKQNLTDEEKERVPQFLSLKSFQQQKQDSSSVSHELESCCNDKLKCFGHCGCDSQRSERLSTEEKVVHDVETETTKASSALLIDRVCLHFSPSNPSQLIGRRVGVKRFDLIGELHVRGFGECVEIILSHLSDADLIRIPAISNTWKSSLLSEPKAHRRYKHICRKANSPKKLAGKENVVGKSSLTEPAPMTASKGHLSSIQPQLVVKDHSKLLHPTLPEHPELSLSSDDVLRNCPHCQSRALVLPGQDRATCLSDKCGYDFCILCFFPFHRSTPCKPLLQAVSKTSLVGTKQSKKNLKRL